MIPYQEPLSKGDNPELSSTLSQTLPMAAIFMRNRYIGWYVTSIIPVDNCSKDHGTPGPIALDPTTIFARRNHTSNES